MIICICIFLGQYIEINPFETKVNGGFGFVMN